MSEGKVFCEVCRDDVDYKITYKDMVGMIRGDEYHYVGQEATCIVCGAEVDVPEVNDYNLKALYDEYRKANCIISLEKIKEIPTKYAIGKRPLSNLLGWGEHTFTRYYEGDIPTRQYSDMLNHIYDDVDFYLSILEENKNRLSSEQSYLKSKAAVLNLINSNKDFTDKINNIVGYFLNKCEDITPLALQKSLYYAQGFFYAFFKQFLFEDDCEAWIHGPVYRDVYFRYSNYKFDPISKVQTFDSSIFSTEEKSILDSVVKNVCCYSGKVLETFTHKESPWLDTRGDLPDDTPSQKVINKNLIADCFINIKNEYNMNSPKDIEKYTKTMFDRLT